MKLDKCERDLLNAVRAARIAHWQQRGDDPDMRKHLLTIPDEWMEEKGYFQLALTALREGTFTRPEDYFPFPPQAQDDQWN
jgi:hypothetical protein